MPNFLLDFTYNLFLPLLKGCPPLGRKEMEPSCTSVKNENVVHIQCWILFSYKKIKFPGKGVNLECIILSKVIQMQKGKHKFIFFLKNHVIYTWLYIRNCSISKVRHLGRWQRVVLMRKTYEMSYDKRHKASFNSHIFLRWLSPWNYENVKPLAKLKHFRKAILILLLFTENHTHITSQDKKENI